MANKLNIKNLWGMLQETVTLFGENALMIRAAALSYYTIFALPPFLLVIMRTTSLFYDQDTIRKTIFGQLREYFGQDSVDQIRTTVDQLGLLEREGWALLVGIGGVLFTATTIFVAIQDTMNTIFKSEEANNNMGWWVFIRRRLTALMLLLAIGFVLVISLTINALLARLTDLIGLYLPWLGSVLLFVISLLLPLLVTALFFALIFKTLPDCAISWRTARIGSIITTILFFIGQYGITFYLGLSNTGNMYDAAGSLMLVMAWIFYASAIFYFGAQFTAVYAERSRVAEAEAAP